MIEVPHNIYGRDGWYVASDDTLLIFKTKPQLPRVFFLRSCHNKMFVCTFKNSYSSIQFIHYIVFLFDAQIDKMQMKIASDMCTVTKKYTQKKKIPDDKWPSNIKKKLY